MKIVRVFFLISSSLALSELFCEYKIIQWEGELVEKCEALDIQFAPLVEGDLTIESVNGSHLEGYSDDDVKTLIIKFKFVEKVPQGLTNLFKNLQELEISSSNLKTISGDDLQEHKNLSTLNLSGNLLTTLPSGLFENTRILEYIDFSYNRLKYIDPDIFDDVPNLNRAFFIKNICTGDDPVYGNDRYAVQYYVEKFLLEHCRPKDNN